MASPRKDLLALCRLDAPAGLERDLLERVADPAYCADLRRLAARHHVYGLTHCVMARSTGRSDAETRDTLRHLRRGAALLQMTRDDLVRTLRSAGIETVVLKGAALLDTLYREPAERDLEDFDVLVRPEDVPRAVDALRSTGYHEHAALPSPQAYARHHFHLPLHHRTRPVVEIHWALSRPFWPFQLDARRVYDDAVVVQSSAGLVMRIPRPEHLILHVVLQNLQESFSRLGRLVDIDRVVARARGLDWDVLIREAHAGCLGPATSLSLQMTSRLLGSPIPESIVRDLRPSPVARFHLAILEPVASLVSQRLSHTLAGRQVQRLWLVGRMRQRLAVLGSFLRADDDAVDLDQHAVGPVRGAIKLLRLVTFQGSAYVAAAARSLTAPGRAQMRFWSSHARSSDLL